MNRLGPPSYIFRKREVSEMTYDDDEYYFDDTYGFRDKYDFDIEDEEENEDEDEVEEEECFSSNETKKRTSVFEVLPYSKLPCYKIDRTIDRIRLEKLLPEKL
jgi:hypothetical protein